MGRPSLARWPPWLSWALPACVAIVVIGYQVWYQVALDPARSPRLFWLETLTFGVAGPVVAWLLLRDIDRRIVAADATAGALNHLQAKERYLASAVESSADAVIGLDPSSLIAAWNQGAEAMFGYTPDAVLGRSPAFLFPGPANQEAWQALVDNETEAGTVRGYEMLAQAQDGQAIPVEVTFARARDDARGFLRGVAILRDVSQRKALIAEQGRRNQELAALYAVSEAVSRSLTETEALSVALERLLEVLQIDAGRIFLWDSRTGKLTVVASDGDLALDAGGEAVLQPGECLCDLSPWPGERLRAVALGSHARILREACRQHRGHACAAVPLLAKERVLGVMQVARRSEHGFSDPEMGLLRSVGAQIGVSVENVRLREEARRAEALGALIQEMHHRIKNNLQTVADLLSLEMSTTDSPEAQHSLRDSIGRIKSIAAVHELLSLEQLRLTNITELAQQVCDISLVHLVRPGQQVTVRVNGPPIFLPSKQATALALVMNELVANALEHGFPDGQPGHLAIDLAETGSRVTVTITDNGRGLPHDFDPLRPTGLGLQIVRTLVEKDLSGTLRLEGRPEGGSLATLVFFR